MPARAMPDLALAPLDMRIEAAALLAARMALAELHRQGADLSEAEVRAIADEAARKAVEEFARRLGLERSDPEESRALRDVFARLVRRERGRGESLKTLRNAAITALVGLAITALVKWQPVARLFP